MTDVSQGDAHRLATQLAGAEGRAARRLRTIKRLEAEVADLTADLVNANEAAWDRQERLTTINAEMAHLLDVSAEDAVKYDAIDALIPEGVTIEQLVATYNAVHDPSHQHFPLDCCLTHVRSVKP